MLAFALALSLAAAEPETTSAEDVSPVRAHLAFVAGMVASTALSASLVYLPTRIQFDVAGRPDPLVTALGLGLAGGLHFAITNLLLPELYRAGGGTPDITATRAETWRYTRWAALVAGVSVVIFGAGAAAEHAQYGRGQLTMIIGMSLGAAAYLAFDALAFIGSSRGYRR